MSALEANQDFGPRLRRLLDDRELRASELARRVGVSANSVSSWTCGRSLPSGERLPAVARALGIGVGELLGEVPEKPQTDAESVVYRLAQLELGPTVRALASALPDLMAVLSEAERQVTESRLGS